MPFLRMKLLSWRTLFPLFIMTLFTGHAFAQVQFFERPYDRQLFARDADDSASVVISGWTELSDSSLLVIRSYRSDLLRDSIVIPVDSFGQTFTALFRIKAERALYRFRVTLNEGQVEQCVLNVDSVVCGDMFLVAGQSNGTATSNGPGTDPPSLWVRTYGTQSASSGDVQTDTLWYLAQGNSGQSSASVGVWALRLMRSLSDSLQIPVAVINGSRNGSSILVNLPSANPQELASIYGRMLYRCRKSGADTKAKALFWYQGESNGDTSYDSYESRFQTLYNAWKNDYPGLSRIYLIQTRPGCLTGSSFVYHGELREIQRKIPSLYSDISFAVSVGVEPFDGCHFYSQGYQQLAANLFPLLLEDTYGLSSLVNYRPPQPIEAFYSNDSNTVVGIRFDQMINWPANQGLYSLNDYFFLQNNLSAVAGFCSGDTLFLRFNSASNSETISYLPNIYYTGTNDVYVGPWLKNNQQIAVPSFKGIPISNSVVLSGSDSVACLGDSVVLTCNKVGQIYQWTRNDSLICSGALSSLQVGEGGVYRVSVTDFNGLSAQSNSFALNFNGAGEMFTVSGPNNPLCPGSSVTLAASGGQEWLWNTGSTDSLLEVDSPGSYFFRSIDSLGCTVYSDTLYLTAASIDSVFITGSGVLDCSVDTIYLSLSQTYPGIWSNGSSDSVVAVTEPGAYWFVAVNENLCPVWSDTVWVNELLVPDSLFISSSGNLDCNSDTVFLSLSQTYPGIWSNGSSDSVVAVTDPGAYWFVAVSENLCPVWSDTVWVNLQPPPVYMVAYDDLSACQGDSVRLYIQDSLSQISWNTGQEGAVIWVHQSGYYHASLLTTEGCQVSTDSVYVDIQSINASVNPSGLILACPNNKPTLNAATGAGYQYQWFNNGQAISGATSSTYFVSVSAVYSLTVRITNPDGCSVISDPVSVNLRSAPNATVTVSNQFDFCNDSLATLTANAGNLTYQWQRNGLNIPGATQRIYNSSLAGQYRVIVTNSNGCFRASSQVKLPANTLTATVSILGSSTICLGDSSLLGSNTGAGYTYQWKRNNVDIVGANSPQYYAKKTGTYRVFITNTSGCSVLSPGKYITVSSCDVNSRLSNPDNEWEVEVYPNPFSSSVMVHTDQAGQCDYLIFDLQGRVVQSGQLSAGEQLIDTEFPSGVYFLEIRPENAMSKLVRLVKSGSEN